MSRLAKAKAAPLSHLFGGSPATLAPLLLSSLVINLLGLALPLAALQVYDRVLAQNAHSSWLALCALVLLAALAEAALRLARASLMAWQGAWQEQNLFTRQLAHLLRVDPHPLLAHGTGTPLQTLEGLTQLREFSSGQALTVLLEVPFIAVYLGLICLLGGWLVWLPTGLLLVFAGRALGQGKQLTGALAQREKADAHRFSQLIDMLSQIHSVKALGALRLLQRQAEAGQAASSRASWRVAMLSHTAYQDGLLFGQLVLVALLAAGAPLALAGYLSLGSLMACILLGGRLMAPVQRALGFYTRVQEARLAHRRLAANLQLPVSFAGTAVATERPGSLAVTNLSLPSLVTSASFNLQAGQALALSADHEAAGAALLETLAGLRLPTSGSVLLDGVTPHQLPAHELVRHVGYLPPLGTIYQGTVYENLSRFGLTPRAQVVEAAQLLGLTDAIDRLPHGWETVLENTAADPLPPGMRQRLCLGRILAVKPRVILFYQADRNLDRAGYNLVHNLFARLKSRVALVLFTTDGNLRALADTALHLAADGTLRPLSLTQTSPYKPNVAPLFVAPPTLAA